MRMGLCRAVLQVVRLRTHPGIPGPATRRVLARILRSRVNARDRYARTFRSAVLRVLDAQSRFAGLGEVAEVHMGHALRPFQREVPTASARRVDE
jgi:hypothetical protein